MADKNNLPRPTSISSRRQPSRLQRRAPATLNISPAAEWHVAIPLLSPLVSPSSSPKTNNPMNNKSSSAIDRTAQINSSRDADNPTADKPSAVFKTWQHPAAPFCYDSAPMVRPFVPV